MKTSLVPARHLGIRRIILCLTILSLFVIASAATLPASAASPCGHSSTGPRRVILADDQREPCVGTTNPSSNGDESTRNSKPPPAIIEKPKPVGVTLNGIDENPGGDAWLDRGWLNDLGMGGGGSGGGGGDSAFGCEKSGGGRIHEVAC